MAGNRVSSQELVQFYARDLALKKWGYFGTLGFRRRSVPFWVAQRCFMAWMFALEGDCEVSCRWFRINAHGAFPDRPLFHILVGRLSESKYSLTAAWQEIAGDAELEYFYPHGKAFTFIADIARRRAEFEIDYNLD